MSIWIGVLLVIGAVVLIVYANGGRKRSPVVQKPEEGKPPKQLSAGMDQQHALSEATGEKLAPDKARQWLDSFLQKQQK